MSATEACANFVPYGFEALELARQSHMAAILFAWRNYLAYATSVTFCGELGEDLDATPTIGGGWID